MKKEFQPFIPIQKFGIRDVLVLLLIAITFFLASRVIQSEKTEFVVVVVKEKVENEVDFYRAKSKEKIAEFIMEKTGI